MRDTIFAPATIIGKAGIAVIRISGPNATLAINALGYNKLPAPRIATLAKLYSPSSKELIDEAIIIWFQGPKSFTGEDVVELHTHGSKAVINALMEVLSTIKGFRVAGPGEFSIQSFSNGKMDLTTAEGLADLIEAETSMQLKQALRQMQGELGQLYESWRVQLIKASSLVEAYIDFPDEDLPTNVIKELREVVDSLINTIDEHLNDNRKGEILRNGLHITILGAPNVGKSSLLNLLAKREVAIVSNIAGTTRDIIEVNLDIAGYLVTLADTAGIREDADIIEKEGIKRALDKAGYTDLKLVLFDASLLPDLDPFTLKLIDDKTIILFNKTDIAKEALPENIHGIKPLGVAIEKNIGVDELLNLLKDYVTKELGTSSAPVLTRVRHRQNLQECQKSLQHFTLDKDIELAAEDLRMACVYLGRITGKIDVDTILGEIFSNFCIGK